MIEDEEQKIYVKIPEDETTRFVIDKLAKLYSRYGVEVEKEFNLVLEKGNKI